jgi:hypothetical protein
MTAPTSAPSGRPVAAPPITPPSTPPTMAPPTVLFCAAAGRIVACCTDSASAKTATAPKIRFISISPIPMVPRARTLKNTTGDFKSPAARNAE